jgi:hypothetical protein
VAEGVVVHNSSSHISYSSPEDKLTFFSGGSKHEQFIALFNQDDLLAKFRQNALEHPDVKSITIYGEAYGGKMQGMSHTYGPDLKFIAFEVLINREACPEQWMTVPQAEAIANNFGQEFVHYKLIDTTEEAINAEMMADSVQAVRNGMGTGHMREGVVLRPTVELVHPNGGRIIAKHKRPEFAERANTPKVFDPDKQKVIEEANAIAEEFVNAVRLEHVLDAIGITDPKMEDAQKIIKGMQADVFREAAGEIVESKDAARAIGKQTMKVLKARLMESIRQTDPKEL